MHKISIKWHSSIKEIEKEEWEELIQENIMPFYKWEWLHALEKSRSIIPRHGWQPLYLSISRENSIIGVAPLFIKSHSYGEFIFDNQFVELANYLNLNYYPKLIGMSPLSPVQGYRFLFAPNESEEELTKLMIVEIDKFCLENKILSCNFLYVDPTWKIYAENANCAKWINLRSIWSKNGIKHFEDYLENFNSNQRRNIKRERQSIKHNRLNISVRNGADLDIQSMKLMHHFYEQHCNRWGIWGSKYLTEEFFIELASSQLRDQVVIFSANKENSSEPLAMSLCITNGEILWGRYWGSYEEIRNLHFELCYYSPIEWAINNGIKHFDPGAGGNHKRRRGFVAQPNTSLHRWYDPRMDKIIRSWLPKVNQLMLEEIKLTNDEVPFKIDKPKLSKIE